MSDFNVRSDSIDVEQIMEQIRARIREKRGVDYTEQQLRELAAVKLEKMIDPRGLRSDLIEQFRKRRPTVYPPLELPELPAFDAGPMTPLPPSEPLRVSSDLMYSFETESIYTTHRAPLRFIRKLLNPLLKLLFNPNPIIDALHRQGRLNHLLLEYASDRDRRLVDRDRDVVHRDTQIVERNQAIAARDRLIVERDNVREIERVDRREMDALYYEIIHNLVFELTRLGIENKNLTMRVESLTGRLEFNERRARALESVVVYKPGDGDAGRDAGRPSPPQPPPPAPPAAAAGAAAPSPTPGAAEGPGQRSRRRRRRRGRRGGQPAAAIMGAPSSAASPAPPAPSSGSSPPADAAAAAPATSAPDAAAARDAAAAHHETAESVERALPPEAQPSEGGSGGGRPPEQ